MRLIVASGSARASIGELADGEQRAIVCRGQFTFGDLLVELSRQVGRCDLAVSTWTTAAADVESFALLARRGNFSRIRVLVDVSFYKREIARAKRNGGRSALDPLESAFPGCVWTLKTHAKFAVMTGGKFDVVVFSSANLNRNLRLENYTIHCDAELAVDVVAFADSAMPVDDVGICRSAMGKAASTRKAVRGAAMSTKPWLRSQKVV